jgi:hypothetical protein
MMPNIAAARSPGTRAELPCHSRSCPGGLTSATGEHVKVDQVDRQERVVVAEILKIRSAR